MHAITSKILLNQDNTRKLVKNTLRALGNRKVIASMLIFSLLTLDVPMMHQIEAADVDPALWVTVPVKADPMMQGLTIPADATTKGMWSNVKSWPLNGLHASILPDGKVLSYGSNLNGDEQNGRYFDLWDPEVGFGNNSHQTTYRAQQQDSFCSNATYLSDGRMIISGGNGGKTTTIYTPSTNSVQTASYNLALDRWYSTLINLPDGRPIMLGGMVPYAEGMVDNPDLAITQGLASMTPEVLETNGWRSLFGAYSREAFGPDYLRTSFPRAFVAPNGQIFGISAEKMWYLDANGNGSINVVGNFKTAYSAQSPNNVGSTNTAVMYAPGKILVVGGNGGWVGQDLPSSNMATSVDINGVTPVLTEQPRMTFPRRFPNSIVLANGQVVVTGGSRFGNSNGANSVFSAEIWDPSTSAWSVGANAAIFRGYHSTTVLMPNGAILSLAGGAPGPVTNTNAEVYYPPYLFSNTANGAQLVTRPVIQAISGLAYDHEAPIQMDMSNTDSISQLVLIGISKATHAFNTGQRRIPLTFSQESNRLTATTPNANLTPPGYYQVVAINSNGVPSLGTIVAIGQNVAPPNVPTTPYDPPVINGQIDAPVISSGGTASYNVTALSNTTYSWNFGDGSPDTPYNANPAVSHTFPQPGAYVVTLSARDSAGLISRRTFLQAVATSKTAKNPSNSSPITIENRGANPARIWVVNPDNDSVSVLDEATNELMASIDVGTSPRTIAVAPDGRIWVTNKKSTTISIISPTTLSVVQTLTLPRASQPHGLAFDPNGSSAFVALEASGQLLKLNASTGVQQGIVNVAPNVRHVAINADASMVLVSRFISPTASGEGTTVIDTSNAGGEVIAVNANTLQVTTTVKLAHSDKGDTPTQGSGLPNYLAAPVISPDGTMAWVPSKQDNIKRGLLRNGLQLDFQNTVRAISSRINMTTLTEDYVRRIDHDNASLASAAAYHPSGVYGFIALETSRQVAVIDAIGGRELFRLEVGRAPQGLALSADGNTLYVHEFMDRSVSIFNLSPLLNQGRLEASRSAITYTIDSEKLAANVVLGKQLFYDARDTRLARDSYMSCATCHNDGGQDGRVWDLTGFGEGLRNTIALNGRGGMSHGFLHWSANFDEVQDFERQIRELSGGQGLLSDQDYAAGTRNQPLGDAKSGFSNALDELSAYVESLNKFDKTPYRDNAGGLTPAASLGKSVFQSNCISCHGSFDFTVSKGANGLRNIGTIKPSSGKRLNTTLSGIDIPTLRDVWGTAPYLHDGSAATLNAAIVAHNGIALSASDISNVVSYIQQIGIEEDGEAPKPSSGTGLNGAYYGTNNLTGNVILQRVESVNFNWGTDTPAATLPADNFSARWSGYIEATVAGAYQLQTNSDDGVRVYLNNQLVIDNWTPHGPTLDTSNTFNMVKGQRLPITVEYQELGGGAVIQLLWRIPGASAFSIVPAAQLYNNNSGSTAPSVSVTSPAAGASFVQGNAITVSANAADSDGTITQVQFYDGATLIGTDTTAPYSISWTNAAVGSHSITARATDNSNATTTSAAVSISVTATNVVPTVSVTSPAAGASFVQGNAITVSANAADSDGTITQVQFYDGATLIGTDTTAPYSISWTNAAVGSHSITARATDNSNATTTSAAVSISVTSSGVGSNGTGLNGAYFSNSNLIGSPSLQRVEAVFFDWGWDSPGPGVPADAFSARWTGYLEATVSGAYQLQTNSDDGVRVYVNNQLVINNWTEHGPTLDTSATFNMTAGQRIPVTVEYFESWAGAVMQLLWKTPGASAFSIVPATQLYNNNSGSTATTVSVTSPAAGASFVQGNAITVSANAADSDGTITQVQFYDGATLIGTDTTAPYSISWTNAAVGSHSITARATDNSNATTTSAAVSISVTATNVVPTVSVTSPAAGASFVQGNAITVSANAADSDGTITQVQFYDGATLIGTDTTAPYSISWTNAAVGSHSITARATDNSNATTTSAAVSISVTATNVVPTVSVTSPAAGASFVQGNAITVSANAADSDGTITQVQFYDGATLIGTDTTAPYSISWTNAAVGSHSITARATDNSNATTTSAAVSISVTATNVVPTVSVTSPAAGASFVQGNAITVSANAADSDGTITQVQFYDGATLIGTDTTAPYSISWTNAAVGSHSITARATDNSNATTTSAAVSISVTATNVVPTVSVTSPAAGASFVQGNAITVSANAADSDGTITQVQFYDGATLIGTDTTAPYSISWTNAAVGSHSITARATDNSNATTTSAAVSISVTATNVVPTVSVTSPAAGASFVQGNAITVSANAADSDGTITQVQFYDGATLIGTDTTAPYSISWTNAAVGSHSITARATDNSNATTTSAAVSISVTSSGVGSNGTGLNGAYFSNSNLIGSPSLQRVEAVFFDWGWDSPGPGVPAEAFSARWTGYIEATVTGVYQIQTNSDDGVRVYLNNQLVINNWTEHGPTLDTSATFNMTAGQRIPVTVEYFESWAGAVMQLLWKTPGASGFTAIPKVQLYTTNN